VPKSKMKPGLPAQSNTACRSRPAHAVVAAFLTKLAKHMALIACLMIAGSATGRAAVSQLQIFFLVACAAVAYSIGQRMARRAPLPGRVPMQQP
jgi:hypothetical protein